MPQALKRALQVCGIVLGLLVAVVAGYAIYLQTTYYRIPDAIAVDVERNPEGAIQTGQEYRAVTFNIGFGAYTPDYTFFMDQGVMEDGTETKGERSLAVSKDVAQANTQGAVSTLVELQPDFVLMQEVDTDSTRSYQIDQKAAAESAFPQLGSAFASNFHTGYLAYPITEPHGFVNSGLLMLGAAHVDSAERRSYPVDDSFPTKFFDLDRCFLVERLPVSNGKQLVMINSHMSAFDEGGVYREKQMKLLESVLAEELAAGNYVIAGGDWNHALCNSQELYECDQKVPVWVALLDESSLPAGMTVVQADNLADVPTCRGSDIPYEKGRSYVVTVDGFFVSDNIEAQSTNIDADFEFTDHNPVLLTFKLK